MQFDESERTQNFAIVLTILYKALQYIWPIWYHDIFIFFRVFHVKWSVCIFMYNKLSIHFGPRYPSITSLSKGPFTNKVLGDGFEITPIALCGP